MSTLPFELNDEVKLGITDGGVEVKTKNFYELIRIPANVDIESIVK